MLTVARKADTCTFVSNHSTTPLLLLLLLLLMSQCLSVCDARPPASRRHGDDLSHPVTSEDVTEDSKQDGFAVFERRDPITGNYDFFCFLNIA